MTNLSDLIERVEAQSMWRNAITNTAAVVDMVRARYADQRRTGATFQAFDEDLNAELQRWFDMTRAAKPNSYEESEALWKDFRALQEKDHPHA